VSQQDGWQGGGALSSPANAGWRRLALLSLGALALLFLVAAAADAAMVASGPAGAIAVTTPSEDGLLTNAPSIQVKGTLTNPAALLEANGAPVTVSTSGTFSAAVPLAEGLNVVRLTALAPGNLRTDLGFLVTRDSQPPFLEVFQPADGAALPTDRALVLGQAERGAQVFVNGRVVEANIFDGSFEVRDLTLPSADGACLQPSAVTVVARDGAGNVRTLVRPVTVNRCVTHPALAAPLPTVVVGQGEPGPLSIDFARFFKDDAGAASLTFSLAVEGAAASSLSASYGPGALTLSWSAPFVGEAVVLVTAHDRDGEASDAAPLRLSVTASPPANLPPVLTLPRAVETLPLGGAVSFSLAVGDPDGDAVTVYPGALPPGVRVVSLERTDAEHYTVTVAADATATPGAARLVLAAADTHLKGAQAAVTLTLYDASGPAGLALVVPENPEVSATGALVGPAGVRGLYVELSSARRLGHLYLADPRDPGAPAEAAPLNEEHTYWRFFLPLSGVAGVYAATVWADDAGLSPEPFTFTITAAAAAAPPLIDRLVALTGDFEFEEGEPVALAWEGAIPLPEATSLEWSVDGGLVAIGPTLEGAVLDPGDHTVTLTATSPQGGSSASATVSVHARPAAALPQRATPWLLYFSVLGAGAAGLVLGGTEIGLYFLFAGLIGAIIDRQSREKLLTHFVRGRIYQIIEYEPGIHLSELQRKAGVARGVCAYHLHALEKAGLVRAARDGMYLRFTATKVKIDADAYALAADDREILAAIEARPGITEREVAEILGKTSHQVERSVRTLAQTGHVEARHEGEAVQLFARTQRGLGAPGLGGP
jgi:predicted transcriptional regulator